MGVCHSINIKCLPLMNTVFQQPLVINIDLVRLNNEHDDGTKKDVNKAVN